MNGKGDRQRPTDLGRFSDNYDRIFSMTTRLFCDRCDDAIPDKGVLTDVYIEKVGMVNRAEAQVFVHVDSPTEEPIVEYKDLCASCYLEFKEWWAR